MAKATDSNITPLDIEALNQLAVRLRDSADAIRNPAAQKKLGTDLHSVADVASAMAHWRFVVAEVAETLPAGNFARNELLDLLGGSDDFTDKLADLGLCFRQVVEQHGLNAVPRWLATELGMPEIVKTEPTADDDEVTATYPAWLLVAEATQP